MREDAGAAHRRVGEEVPELTLAGEWRALLRGRGKERLEAVLPAILHRQRWFGGKARERQQRPRLVDVGTASGAKDAPGAAPAVVRVDYVDGEPEEYVLALAFAEGEEAGRHRGDRARPPCSPQSRGAGQRGQSGVLYDALQDDGDGVASAARRLRCCSTPSRATAGTGPRTGELRRPPRPCRSAQGARAADLPARVLRGEQSNTSIMFGDRYLMKVLRRLEAGESPGRRDRPLPVGPASHTCPSCSARSTASRAAAARPRRVAILQRFVPNEGDAWVHTLDELERYAERVLTDPPHGGRARPPAHGARRSPRDPLPESAHELVGPYLDVAHLLGRADRRAARGAGRRAATPAFAPEPFTTLYQRSLYQSMRNALRRGLQQAAKKAATSLSDPAAQRRVVGARGARGRDPRAAADAVDDPDRDHAAPAPTATTTSGRCCGPVVTSSSSTSRANRPGRSASDG